MTDPESVAKVKRLTDDAASRPPLRPSDLAERFPFGEGEWCGAESAERNLADLAAPAWTCTLAAGHDGDLHAAHGVQGQLLVVWHG